LIALRTRLRELMEMAKTVDEMLRVERELARVQTELDMYQGMLTRMGNQIAFSDVDLTLREGRIYGPVGAVFYGLGWGIGKLFVIR